MNAQKSRLGFGSLNWSGLKLSSIFIAVLCFAIYGNTIFNEYALDDWLVTTSKHAQVSKGIEALPEIFTSHYISWQGYQVDYRPIIKASFAFEYQFFGENPAMSHFINVLLYAILCVLLYSLLLKMFPKEQWWVPFASILLFVAHPIHTEVVASLKNRDELFSLIFILLVFHAALRWMELGKLKYLIGALLFLAFSLMSKMSNVTWLPILFAWGYWYKGFEFKKVLKLAGMMVAVVGAYQIFVAVLLGDWLRNFVFIETPYFQISSVADKWASIISAAGYYLKLLVYPDPLCSYYGFDQIPVVSWNSWTVYASIIAYSTLLFFAVRGLFKKDLIGFGAMVILCDLLLFVNVVYPYTGILGERVLFGGTIGAAIMLVGVLKKAATSIKKKSSVLPPKMWVSGLLIVLVVLGSSRTISRNRDWKDNLTLFGTDVLQCPRSAKLHELYALYLRGEYMNSDVQNWKPLAYQAIKENQLCIDIYDKWPIPYHRMAVIYHYDLEKPDSAQVFYEKAIELNPNFFQARKDYAKCLMHIKLFQEAKVQLLHVIEQERTDPELWNDLVSSCLLSNDIETAIRSNAAFLIKFPEREEPHIHEANISLSKGDKERAIKYFEKALLINPNNSALESYVNTLR